jgi:SAM-dependent methyltransferase
MKIINWEKDQIQDFEKEFHDDIYYRRSKDKDYIIGQSRNNNLTYLEWIKKKYKIKGKILDLGGGSGYLTAELSKIKEVEEVWLLEYSQSCLKFLTPEVIKFMKGNDEKIRLVNGSFNKIEKENYFDFVFVFGALHHSSNLRLTTDNINQSLKEGGILFAREPVAHPFTPTSIYLKDLERRTNREGEIRNDNFYRLGEYMTAFYQSCLEMTEHKQYGDLFSINLRKGKNIYDFIVTFIFVCKKENSISKIDNCGWERW